MKERFQKSELIRVSAYLTPDEHRRFKAWCIPQDRGPEAALARLIRETIGGSAHAAAEVRAGVQLPAMRELNLNGVKRAPGFEDEPEEPVGKRAAPNNTNGIHPSSLPPVPLEEDLVDGPVDDWQDYRTEMKSGLNRVFEYWVRMGASDDEAEARVRRDPRMLDWIGEWDPPEIELAWQQMRLLAIKSHAS